MQRVKFWTGKAWSLEMALCGFNCGPLFWALILPSSLFSGFVRQPLVSSAIREATQGSMPESQVTQNDRPLYSKVATS